MSIKKCSFSSEVLIASGDPGGKPTIEAAFLHFSSRHYLTGTDIKNGANNNSVMKHINGGITNIKRVFALKIALAGHEHEHEEDVRIIPRVWLAVHICLLHVNLLFLVINLKM